MNMTHKTHIKFQSRNSKINTEQNIFLFRCVTILLRPMSTFRNTLFAGFILTFLFCSSSIAFAANRYWVGAASGCDGFSGGDWSNASCWSTSSGGATGASVPADTDTAIFDSNSDDADEVSIVDEYYNGVVGAINMQAGNTINVTVGLDTQVLGNITISAGTLDISGGITLRMYTPGSTLQIDAGATLGGDGTMSLYSSEVSTNYTVTNNGTIDVGTFKYHIVGSSMETYSLQVAATTYGTTSETKLDLVAEGGADNPGFLGSFSIGAGTLIVKGMLHVRSTDGSDVTLDNSSNREIQVGGSFELASASYTRGTTDKIIFNGTAYQSFTTAEQAFTDISINNTGDEALDENITIVGSLNIAGDLTMTDGKLDLATNDPNVELGGNVSIASGAIWAKQDDGAATVTFNGTAAKTYEDLNATKQNLGLVSITKTNGTPANNKLTLNTAGGNGMKVDTQIGRA